MKIFLKILLIILWVALAAGAVVLMSFANMSHDQKPCSGLEIHLSSSSSEPLFTELDLKQALIHRFGKFEDRSLDELDIEQLLRYLRKNPNIESVDAHVSIEGKLVVEVEQCIPLVRLLTESGQSYYLDQKGKLLPSNPRYPSRVIVANGTFDVTMKTGSYLFKESDHKTLKNTRLGTLANIHSLAGKMAGDSLMNALVEQIFIRPTGEIWLATKAGKHVVVFGDTSNMEEKFEKLKAFYKYGLTKTGWDKYRIINLTYRNQVVCTK